MKVKKRTGWFYGMVRVCLVGVVVMLLAACSTAEPDVTPTAFATATVPLSTVAPTASSATATAMPEVTALPSATPSPLSAPEGELRPGESVAGVVPEGGASVWQFVAVAGDTISMTVRPIEEGLDVVVNVLREDGESILPTGPLDESFDEEQLAGLVIPADGTYYVWVEDFLGSGGAYELAFGTAEGNWLIPGSVVVGSLPAGGSQEYAFSVTNETDISFFVAPTAELDGVIEVLDRNGLVVASVDEAFAGELDVLAFAPPAGGQFLVRVRGANGEGGGYTLGMGSPTGALVSATGSLVAGGQEEYAFSVPAGAVVLVYAQPDPALDVSLGLYDPAGTRVVTEDTNYGGEADWFVYTTVAAGEHVLRVTSFGETVGNFTVTVLGNGGEVVDPPEALGEPPEATDEAGFVLTAGAFFTVSLGVDEVVRLPFSVPAGERVIFYGLPSEANDSVLAIHDGSDARLVSTDDGFTGEGEVLVFTAPSEGEYVLLVQEFEGRAGVQQIGWVPAGSAYLVETGAIEDGVDAYVVTAPAGGLLVALIIPDPTFDVVLQIDNRTTDVGITGEPEVITFAVTDEGDFPITVSGFSGSTGAYELIVLLIEP